MVEERCNKHALYCLVVSTNPSQSTRMIEHFARYVFATILSVYNKWMFSPNLFGFPAPLFVTTLHMFVQFSLATLIRALWPHHFKPRARPTPNDYV
jgi:hypothetical protein